MPKIPHTITSALVVLHTAQPCWSMMSMLWGDDTANKNALPLSVQLSSDNTPGDPTIIRENAFWGHLHKDTFSTLFPQMRIENPAHYQEQIGYICLYHELKKITLSQDKTHPPLALCQYVIQVRPHMVDLPDTLYLPCALHDFLLKGEKRHNPLFLSAQASTKILFAPALPSDFPPLTPFLNIKIASVPPGHTEQHIIHNITPELASHIRRTFLGLPISTIMSDHLWIISPQINGSQIWHHIQMKPASSFTSLITRKTRFLINMSHSLPSSLPSLSDRASMLRSNLEDLFKSNMIYADLDLYDIATRCPNASKEELMDLCKKVLEIRGRYSPRSQPTLQPPSPLPQLSMQHFEDALDTFKIRYGADNLSPFLPMDEVGIRSQHILIEKMLHNISIERPQTQAFTIMGTPRTGRRTIMAKTLQKLHFYFPYQRLMPHCITLQTPQLLNTIIKDIEHVDAAAIAFPDFDYLIKHAEQTSSSETLSLLFSLLNYRNTRKNIFFLFTIENESLIALKNRFGQVFYRNNFTLSPFSRKDQEDILNHYGVSDKEMTDIFFEPHLMKEPETLEDYLNYGARHRITESGCF